MESSLEAAFEEIRGGGFIACAERFDRAVWQTDGRLSTASHWVFRTESWAYRERTFCVCVEEDVYCGINFCFCE